MEIQGNKRFAEVQVVYKSMVPPSERTTIRSSEDAFNILLEQWSDQIELIEEFNILALTRGNQVLAFCNISKGSAWQTMVGAKEVFTAALVLNASCLILSHNHPSSCLSPSEADCELTKKLVKAAKLLDIVILDHIIVTPHGYYSFADEGII